MSSGDCIDAFHSSNRCKAPAATALTVVDVLILDGADNALRPPIN